MVQESHNEEELLSNQNRQHDSNDIEFQSEMEENNSHREEMHTQSKEQWSKDVQQNNNVQSPINKENINVKTVEMEKE